MIEDWIHYFEKPRFQIQYAFEGDSKEFFGNNVFIFHQSQSIEWEVVDLAIIGVTDSKHSDSTGIGKSPDLIRSYLYGLRKWGREQRIVDLGNIRGKTIDDRYRALEDVVFELISRNIRPIVIGGSQDYTLPLSRAMSRLQPKYRLSLIDPKVDWVSQEVDYSAKGFLGLICDNTTQQPEDLSFVGVQKYFLGESQDSWIINKTYDSLRLGEIRQRGISSVEPWMRDADLVSIDMSVIRQAEMPAHSYPMPNGLSGEEICQLAWYAGLSDQLKILGLFDLDADLDPGGIGAVLAAQIIWHTIEASALRYNDYPIRKLDEYSQFIVHLDDYELDIRFYNNPDNERWWVEVPGEMNDKIVIACEKSDFEKASERDIPEKWYRFIKKNNCKSIGNKNI